MQHKFTLFYYSSQFIRIKFEFIYKFINFLIIIFVALLALFFSSINFHIYFVRFFFYSRFNSLVDWHIPCTDLSVFVRLLVPTNIINNDLECDCIKNLPEKLFWLIRFMFRSPAPGKCETVFVFGCIEMDDILIYFAFI